MKAKKKHNKKFWKMFFFLQELFFFEKSKCLNYVLSNPPVASQSTGSLTNHAVPRSLNKIRVKYSNYQKQVFLIMIAAKGFLYFFPGNVS